MGYRSGRSGEPPWLSRRAQRWFRRRTFGGWSGSGGPDAAELAHARAASGARVSVVLPALDEAETIAQICRTIVDRLMTDAHLVDELVVVDCASSDGTPEVARAAGAVVVDAGEILPEIPVVAGKGEALWRSLAAISGDIVVWIDSDIRNFAPHFVTRLVAPLIADPSIAFVKGFYRRPIAGESGLVPGEGGRVTELLARPLIAALFPELGGFVQPLAGEYAGRVDVLRRVPFFTGYSVEIGLLIDLLDAVGLDALAQADLDERVHRNRPLVELAPMAHVIARTIMRRAEERGRIRSALARPGGPVLLPGADGISSREVIEFERPPMDVLDDAVSAG